MKQSRLMELAGVGLQLNELGTEGIDVEQKQDTIGVLRQKLKQEGINTSSMSDILILKFANAMKSITIESLKGKTEKVSKVVERLRHLGGVQLNELENYDVEEKKDTIIDLRLKLRKAGVDTRNMSNDMVLKYAHKMEEITIESIINGGVLSEMDQDVHRAINWLDRQDIQDILERYGFAVNDDESTDDLRDALRSNVEDGTIDMNEVS